MKPNLFMVTIVGHSGMFCGVVGGFTTLEGAVDGIRRYEENRVAENPHFRPCEDYRTSEESTRSEGKEWTIDGRTYNYVITPRVIDVVP